MKDDDKENLIEFIIYLAVLLGFIGLFLHFYFKG